MGKTIWKLDTCDCEMNIEWDGDVALEKREHTYTFKKRCDMHEKQSARPGAVVADNRAKNMGIGDVARVSGIEPTELVWEREGDDFAVRRVKVPGK